MTRERWTEIDALFSGLLVPPDPALDAALAASDAAGLPPHAVSATEGRLLQILAAAVGAREILELGTLGGYSTIWLARGLAPGGRLITLEAHPGYAAVARANLERAGVAGAVEIRTGPALETLRTLAGPFDLVFIDADKRSNPAYLPEILRLVRPGSLIVADNVVREGGVAAAADPDAAGVRRFLELLGQEPRLVATAVQTVGVKGHDGFALALVR